MIGVPIIFVVTITANVTLTTTAETVLMTLPGISTRFAGEVVKMLGHFVLTTGVATTTVTPRVRRGTAITDPLVGEANAVTIPTAAGGTDLYQLQVEDSPGAVAGQQYVLTAQQAAATGNGTALAGQLLAIVGG